MRLHHPTDDDIDCPATRAAERWTARHLGDVRHERNVATIAADLFDLTRPLHRLPDAGRRLLGLAAVVHDVGRCVSKADHPAEGAWMILSDASLPLSEPERRALAYLTLYHRDAVPALAQDAVLHPGDDAPGLLRLLALLRTADALDSRRDTLDGTHPVFALSGHPRRGRDRYRWNPAPRVLSVICSVPAAGEAHRVYARPKKFRLLEELLDLRVDVQVSDTASAIGPLRTAA